MDPFEVRMQFLSNLRKLNATQSSIQKAVGFAIKYFSRCGEDLWDCILEECQKGSLNVRINILYLLDSLCEASVHYQQGPGLNLPAASGSSRKPASYVEYVSRDLDQIVQLAVPDNRDGLVNLASARQILESWRTKRVLDPAVVDQVVLTLDQRRENLHSQPVSIKSSSTTEFSKDEILRRFEEDRERHKLLRQKRWFLPIPTQPASHQQPKLATALLLTNPAMANQNPSSSSNPNSSVSPTSPSQSRRDSIIMPGTSSSYHHGAEVALDIEFDQAWETTSDWNEDDDEVALEENALCFPMDVHSQQYQQPQQHQQPPPQQQARYGYGQGPSRSSDEMDLS
ncbi:hypothetical protein FRB95_003323 [Tulasnella sp. JGI-2019a]|nr:hypothetical protein FRB93_005066 [Tulasnella sp. JGI-2019a]KAG9030939.1 hypothetical protein FRB95_003323 [Tulasnella sp. JGI-2019a]